MKKSKNNNGNKSPLTMLDQKQGSMLDIKTNEDFNNEHPDHDEQGLINTSENLVDKNIGKNNKINLNKKNEESYSTQKI